MNSDGTRFGILLATWFGCGLAPKAPGTVGSLAAALIGVVLHEYAGFIWWQYLVLAAVATAPAVWSADLTARALKLKDPQIVVIDEVLGQWVAFAGARELTPVSYAADLQFAARNCRGRCHLRDLGLGVARFTQSHLIKIEPSRCK